jgi:hypothetical protein
VIALLAANRIDRATTASEIASAIEEQASATIEISRNVQQASPILSAPLKNASSGAAAAVSRRPIDPSCIVQDTAADFIEANLGAVVRVMTMLELIKFQTATQTSHEVASGLESASMAYG